ncbi:MAG: prepilin-type N-terminal cleavage/methylation domain-containing protein [Gammaproteobacteria bacterium]|nr:prepilin-type N-terminal cleavage/methylation domain-containing protein [Gammaproteobacteria bacterium]
MQKQGFVLLEVITAVVILSTLMVVTTQVWQSMAKNRYQQEWVTDAEMIRQASLDYWGSQGAPPTVLNDIFTPAQLATLAQPWQQSWSLLETENWLELSLTAPSAADAKWFASQIAGAFVQAERIVVPIWQPVGNTSTEHLLHRTNVFGKPHLNSMEADLDMTNQAINNVGTLSVNQVTADAIQARTIFGTQVRASTIDVDTLQVTDVITPYNSLSDLAYWVGEYEQLWESCKQQGKCT